VVLRVREDVTVADISHGKPRIGVHARALCAARGTAHART
jgi:hypothetical protein